MRLAVSGFGSRTPPHLRVELDIAARGDIVGLRKMEQEIICVLCGEKVGESSRTFEQRLVGDEDFCATCWNEIMHDGHEAPFTFSSQESAKIPWAN